MFVGKAISCMYHYPLIAYSSCSVLGWTILSNEQISGKEWSRAKAITNKHIFRKIDGHWISIITDLVFICSLISLMNLCCSLRQLIPTNPEPKITFLLCFQFPDGFNIITALNFFLGLAFSVCLIEADGEFISEHRAAALRHRKHLSSETSYILSVRFWLSVEDLRVCVVTPVYFINSVLNSSLWGAICKATFAQRDPSIRQSLSANPSYLTEVVGAFVQSAARKQGPLSPLVWLRFLEK